MSSDTFSILLAFGVVLLVIVIFIRISMRIRKRGGSMMTMMHGATHEMLNKDRREAVEELLEVKANKKMEEQKSGKNKNAI